MLPAGRRAYSPLLRTGKRRCFAKKVLGLSQDPQDSSVTVRAKLKADPCNQKSKDSENDHQRLSGLGRRSHLITCCEPATSSPCYIQSSFPSESAARVNS